MPESIKVWLDDQIGISGQFLWLRRADGTLLNTGGDALAESPAGSGQFVATLAESRTGLGILRATITGSNDPADAVAAGWLAESASLVVEDYPQSASGGAGDASQTTLLATKAAVDSIAVALAGSAPVEPTGRIANGGRILAYVGDDFTVRSGTALPIPVKDPAGGLYTLLTSIGAEHLKFGASLAGKPAGLITGTIASLSQSGSGASQLCNITVEITNCGVGLKLSEDYEWQIQSTQTHGDATDTLIRLEGMLSLRRNVVG